jgi:hypothetical protein
VVDITHCRSSSAFQQSSRCFDQAACPAASAAPSRAASRSIAARLLSPQISSCACPLARAQSKLASIVPSAGGVAVFVTGVASA